MTTNSADTKNRLDILNSNVREAQDTLIRLKTQCQIATSDLENKISTNKELFSNIENLNLEDSFFDIEKLPNLISKLEEIKVQLEQKIQDLVIKLETSYSEFDTRRRSP